MKARLAVDGWRTSSKYKRWKNPADTPTHTLFVNPLSLLPRFFVQRPLDTNPETAELGLAVFRFLLEEIQGSDGVESIVAGFVFLYPFGKEVVMRNHDLGNASTADVHLLCIRFTGFPYEGPVCFREAMVHRSICNSRHIDNQLLPSIDGWEDSCRVNQSRSSI